MHFQIYIYVYNQGLSIFYKLYSSSPFSMNKISNKKALEPTEQRESGIKPTERGNKKRSTASLKV